MNKPRFIMLVGLPASGKSVYAEKLAKEIDAIVCSSDQIRTEVFNDVQDQSNNGEVFRILHKIVKEKLSNGNNVIYDACNISSKRRRAFLKELKNINCNKECVIIARKYENCVEYNEEREREVPNEVIRRMYLHWEVPYWFEGWDDIRFEFTDKDQNEYGTGFVYIIKNHLDKFDQDNPNHELTLGDHMYVTLLNIKESNYDCPELRVAAFIHDIGKPFTKSYINSKGVVTEIAHYYQHHCVGAYEAMFFSHEKKLDYCILINLHMYPYFWKNSKNENAVKDKYRKIWGVDLYDKVMALHEADKNAH